MNRDRKNKFNKIDGGAAVPSFNWTQHQRGLKASRARAAGVVRDEPMPEEWKKLADELPGAPQPPQQDQGQVVDTLAHKYDIQNGCARITADVFYNLLFNREKYRTLMDLVDRVQINGALSGPIEFIPNKKEGKLDFLPDDASICKTAEVKRHGLAAAMRGREQAGLVSNGVVYGLLRKQDSADCNAAKALARALPDTNAKEYKRNRLTNRFWQALGSPGTMMRVAETIKDWPEGHVLNAEVHYSRGPQISLWDRTLASSLKRPVARAFHPKQVISLADEFRDAVLNRREALKFSNILAKTNRTKEDAKQAELLFPDNKPVRFFYNGVPVLVLTPPDYRPASPQSPDPAGG